MRFETATVFGQSFQRNQEPAVFMTLWISDFAGNTAR